MTSGHLVHTLRAVFRALTQGDSFRDVLLAEVDLGVGADPAGVLTGLLAGRIRGCEGIPENWRRILWVRDKIMAIAEDLCTMRPIDQRQRSD